MHKMDPLNVALAQDQALLAQLSTIVKSLSNLNVNGVVYFPRVVKVSDVVSILRCNNHNGFPVIDHTSHWTDVMKSKVDFQHSPLPCDLRGGSMPIRHNLSEFVKPVSSKGISIEDIHHGYLND
ncbi:hypothetical protein ACH5RR_036375 [Cinchona calisaya]|uniref:Uncharacterized protein n=1 Tax=Cinchona calisaya TaxID=153742 RepID=A0ABD2Y5D9_9GENT